MVHHGGRRVWSDRRDGRHALDRVRTTSDGSALHRRTLACADLGAFVSKEIDRTDNVLRDGVSLCDGSQRDFCAAGFHPGCDRGFAKRGPSRCCGCDLLPLALRCCRSTSRELWVGGGAEGMASIDRDPAASIRQGAQRRQCDRCHRDDPCGRSDRSRRGTPTAILLPGINV